MGFHYGYEKRKFDKEWTRLEQEYRAAGMSDTQIAAMREYDWSWFCSQRTYLNRVQALPSEQCGEQFQSLATSACRYPSTMRRVNSSRSSSDNLQSRRYSLSSSKEESQPNRCASTSPVSQVQERDSNFRSRQDCSLSSSHCSLGKACTRFR